MTTWLSYLIRKWIHVFHSLGISSVGVGEAQKDTSLTKLFRKSEWWGTAEKHLLKGSESTQNPEVIFFILFSLRASLKNLDRGWASSSLDIFDNGGVDSCSRTQQHSWHISFLKTSALMTFAVDLLKDTAAAAASQSFVTWLAAWTHLPENHHRKEQWGWPWPILRWHFFSFQCEQQRTVAFCE